MDNNEKNFEILSRKNMEETEENSGNSAKEPKRQKGIYILGIILVLVVVMAIAFFALNKNKENEKPEDISQEMYDTALYAVKVCDLYLDGTATQEDTKKKIREINIPEFDVTSSSLKEVEIWSGIMGLRSDCMMMGIDKFNLTSFKEHRDKIAEAINYKE